jgi:hypothetical protein
VVGGRDRKGGDATTRATAETEMSKAARMFAFVFDGEAQALPSATGRRVVRAMVAALAVAAGSTAALLALIGRPDWWRGLIAATVVSALALGLSLVPLLWGLRRSLNAAVAGYFLAMGVRMGVSLGGCLLVIMAGGYPADATLLLMAVLYAAVLLAEAAVMAVAMWSSGGPAKSVPPTRAD